MKYFYFSYISFLHVYYVLCLASPSVTILVITDKSICVSCLIQAVYAREQT
jgi:hypothetical protein